MNIRLSSIISAEQIFKIYNNCRESMKLKNIFQWTEKYPNPDIVMNDITNGELYELYNDTEITGVICLNKKQDPQYCSINWLDDKGKALIIHRLAINPLYQNQGFGGTLMDFAENYALNAGCTSIRLDAFSGNPMSLRLYERMNYKKRGEIHFPERDLPFICYEKMV